MTKQTSTSGRQSAFDAWVIKDLEKSGLTPDTFHIEPLRSEAELKERLGFADIGNTSIMGVGGYWIRYSNVPGYRRLKLREKVGDVKYLSPKNGGNHAYILPQVAEIATKFNPDKPLFFTEGEKKAAKATLEGFPCIGLSGVWCFKDKDNDFLPELENLDLKGRKCYIVFDSDISHKLSVRQAEQRLAIEIINRGGIPFSVRLPNDGENGKLDGYLAGCGAKALWKLVGEAKPTLDLKLKPVCVRDLEDTNSVESIWGDILYPESITQLNAEPGVGKTTFFYNVCLHGAKGQPFLGIPFPKQIKTLYIDAETPRWRRKSKLKAINEDGDLPGNLYMLDWLDLKKDYHSLLLLCQIEKYDLVVFDTQSRIFNMEKENDNAEANQIMSLLRELANQTGCAIVLIHHTTKGDEGSGVYRGRGASAIAGAVDIVVNMSALDEEVIKLTVPKNRIIGTNPTLFMRKAGEDRFEPHTPPGESSGFEIFTAQHFILSFLEGVEHSTFEICQEGQGKGFAERTLKRALGRLVQAGKIQRTRRGFYSLCHLCHCASSIPDTSGTMAQTQDEDSWEGEAKEFLEKVGGAQ